VRARDRLVFRLRTLWWKGAWGLATKMVCRRIEVTGLGSVPDGPVVFAANHGSHADTVVLQLLFAGAGRDDVLTAGAADYFFRARMLSGFARFIGVFPFPKHGEEGVRRSRAALAAGWSVLIYPQGTRDGGPFRAGVARVARETAPVVPVHITGTTKVLPKGRRVPRRSPITVRFGHPLAVAPTEPDSAFARRLECAVFGPAPHREPA